MRAFPWLFLLALAPAVAAERWVYIPANFQVDAEADRVIALLRRAGAAGYDHALLSGSKFARLGTVIEGYFANVGRVREAAADPERLGQLRDEVRAEAAGGAR